MRRRGDDAARVAAGNRDLFGGSGSARALEASVAWNRMMRRLAAAAKRRELARDQAEEDDARNA